MEATLRRLTGMFAFALWDRESRELILARDRFGEKPLYYGWLQGRFVFASELKALTALPQWRAEIDRNALALLIRFGYVPAPHCIWQGLRKLLPGHWLRINSPRENGGERSAPYWSMAETVRAAMAKPFDGDVRQALDGLHERLSRTIRRQMIADVPLGAFLSGGIDSSLVVALMQEQSLAPVRTFSIGFQDPQYNEAEQAKAVARHLGTAHTELYVTPQETLGVIPLLPSLYDEPFADASQVPTSILCRLVRSQVTVSLSGDGGDELFGGYNRYSWGRTVWNQASPWPAAWRRLAARCVTAVPAERWNTLFRLAGPALPAKLRQRVPGDRLHKLAGVLDADSIEDLYLRLVSSWPDPANVVNEGCEAVGVLAPRNRPALHFGHEPANDVPRCGDLSAGRYSGQGGPRCHGGQPRDPRALP